MSIVVKRFTVMANGKRYEVGDVIPKLKPEEEKRLVEKGYCDYAPSSDSSKVSKTNDAGSKNPEPPPGAATDEDGPNTSIPL